MDGSMEGWTSCVRDYRVVCTRRFGQTVSVACVLFSFIGIVLPFRRRRVCLP